MHSEALRARVAGVDGFHADDFQPQREGAGLRKPERQTSCYISLWTISTRLFSLPVRERVFLPLLAAFTLAPRRCGGGGGASPLRLALALPFHRRVRRPQGRILGDDVWSRHLRRNQTLVGARCCSFRVFGLLATAAAASTTAVRVLSFGRCEQDVFRRHRGGHEGRRARVDGVEEIRG